LGAALLVVTAAGVLAAPLVIAIFAPGFLRDPDEYSLAVSLLRITFPYLGFVSLTALAGAVLNTFRQFAIPALTPVLLNISMILCAVWLAPRFAEPITALAWGVFLGGLVQLGLQVPFLARLGLLVRPVVRLADPGVRKILKLMGPAIFGVSIAQINLLLDTLLASFLVSGSISWLYYSDRMVEFPLGVFGIALGTVILPTLSAHHAGGQPELFQHTLDWGLRWMIVIGAPATLGLALLSEPILSTVFQYNAMSERDVAMAGMSLKAYAAGLIGFIAVKILAPGYYARHDTRTPVRIGVITMVVNMGLNLILMFPLKHAGLALATSLAAFLNAGLLLRGLLSSAAYRPRPGWPALLLRVVLGSALMSGVLIWGVPELSAWSSAAAIERAGRLFMWIALGAAVYGATLIATGFRARHLAHP
jgi:putative peptidoglycan lipid II flippase